jgi:hypothetical protein
MEEERTTAVVQRYLDELAGDGPAEPVTRAPASRSAFTGSVNSDSSTPSAARTATRKSVSLDMLILLR